MNLFLLLLSFLLLRVSAVSHAAVPAQVYWNAVLPHTPMPGAISELIPTDDQLTDEKTGTSVNVGKGGVSVNTGKGKPGGTTVNVGSKGGVGVNVGGHGGGTNVGVGGGGVHVSNGKGKTNVNVGKGGVGVNVGGHGGTHVGVGKGGVGVSTGPKGKPPVIVKVGNSPFNYRYAASETQLHDDPNAALFFLEKDMHPGAKMKLYFGKTPSGAAFIPRSTANSIPFSSAKLPEILNHFFMSPNSDEAEITEKTLKECEEPGVKGERKYCATSLESMVEFSMSSLKTTNIQATSTTAATKKEGVQLQLYTVAPSGAQPMAGSKLVACHPEAYAYAVFYCHATSTARGYKVPLVGADGSKVEAVAVCHTNTAAWNPKHLAFQVLKVKPGSVPICHFLPQDHVVWS